MFWGRTKRDSPHKSRSEITWFVSLKAAHIPDVAVACHRGHGRKAGDLGAISFCPSLRKSPPGQLCESPRLRLGLHVTHRPRAHMTGVLFRKDGTGRKNRHRGTWTGHRTDSSRHQSRGQHVAPVGSARGGRSEPTGSAANLGALELGLPVPVHHRLLPTPVFPDPGSGSRGGWATSPG